MSDSGSAPIISAAVSMRTDAVVALADVIGSECDDKNKCQKDCHPKAEQSYCCMWIACEWVHGYSFEICALTRQNIRQL